MQPRTVPRGSAGSKPPHLATIQRSKAPHAATLPRGRSAAGGPDAVQRTSQASLADKATAIWNKVEGSERARAATTIAVFRCDDGGTYASSNDVGKLGEAAQSEAGKQGISTSIQQAGAGYHAEMWALILTDQADLTIERIGASRACCKQCSAVLEVRGIAADVTSEDQYESWVNPLTNGDDGKPLSDFESEQRKDIPDFRLWSKNYWYYRAEGKIVWGNIPRSG